MFLFLANLSGPSPGSTNSGLPAPSGRGRLLGLVGRDNAGLFYMKLQCRAKYNESLLCLLGAFSELVNNGVSGQPQPQLERNQVYF